MYVLQNPGFEKPYQQLNLCDVKMSADCPVECLDHVSDEPSQLECY